MTRIVIPYSPKIELPNYTKTFSENRADMLTELRCVSALPKLAQGLDRGSLYKLVATPEGGRLFKDSAGNLKGVFYKDGKIIQHARLQSVRPSFIKAATTIGSQVLLVSIAMQLNRIEKQLSKIVQELHRDRVSEIYAGAKMFHQALMIKNKTQRLEQFNAARSLLMQGFEKTSNALKTQIEEAPDAHIGFWDNWFGNKAQLAQTKLMLAEESFEACILAIKTLVECYSAIEEPEAAAKALEDGIEKLDAAGIEDAAEKARLLPRSSGVFPEEPWQLFLDQKADFKNRIDNFRFCSRGEISAVEIEFKREELMRR